MVCFPVCFMASLDLSAYFKRIGYQGATTPTLDVLHALTRAHAQSIPFENLDVVLRQPILLDTPHVFDKLVTRRRGGYCFEQNGLLMAVLQQLGFTVRPLSARVRLRTPDRSEIPVRTHLFLAVTLEGEEWLTDVGIGSPSLTRALQWKADVVQETPHDQRRLVREGERWFHQLWKEGAWLDVAEFTGELFLPCDWKVASWYTSTHPDSSFMQGLIVARALPDGGRLTLSGNEMRHWHRDGRLDVTPVAQDDLPQVLRERFNLYAERVPPAGV